jgi:hypothetical protein
MRLLSITVTDTELAGQSGTQKKQRPYGLIFHLNLLLTLTVNRKYIKKISGYFKMMSKKITGRLNSQPVGFCF